MSNIFLPARTLNEVERSITHFDQDYEIALYRNRKMRIDPKTGEIGATHIAFPHGRGQAGTFFTGIPCELLYHDQGTANTSVAGTAAEVVMNLINPFGQSAMIPAGFWLPSGGIGRFAKVVLRGIATVAASAGTAIFTTRMGALASTSATIAGITPTLFPATPTAATASMWEQELDIELQAYGTVSAQSVCRGLGKVGFPGQVLPSMGFFPMTGQTALSNGLTAATVDTTINNFLSCNQTCTAASVTAIQLLQMFVYGMG
jgi:hypothetical protein